MADVVATSSEPALGAIRLAWWRERLEQLDEGGEAPAEPRLQAVAGELLGRGVSGVELSRLEDGWLPLLEPFPWGDVQAAGLRLRGRLLFGLSAGLLGGRGEDAERAGEMWSLVDGAMHCSDSASREFLSGEARKLLAAPQPAMPRKLRPLTVLAALAAVDLVRAGGGLARLSAAIRHRLMGTLPRG